MDINFKRATEEDLEQAIKEVLASTSQMIEGTIGIFHCRIGMGFSLEESFWHALDSTDLAPLLAKAKEATTRLLCLYQKVQVTSEAMSRLNSEGKYRTVSDLLTDTIYSVDFGKLPLEKASVFDGLSDIQEYKGSELLNALDSEMHKVLGYWATLKYGKGKETSTEAIEAIQSEVNRREQATRDYFAEQDRFRAERLKVLNSMRFTSSAHNTSSGIPKQSKRDHRKSSSTPSQPSTNVVYIDNSTTYSSSDSSSSPSSSSESSWSSSDSSSSSSSDWGSSGSDYSSSDSGSFGSDY